jgi:hypothetical protein
VNPLNHQLGPLAKVSLAFLFVAVPVVVPMGLLWFVLG